MAHLADSAAAAAEPDLRDYWRLLKPRVMSLVVFTAAVGMVSAPAVPHPVIGLASLVCIAVGAGASGALNMWHDADIDALMRRTAGRPVPSGRVGADEALALGLGLSGLSVAFLFLFANALAAGLLAFTIAFYAVVYTIWLKRRTPQNIVVGGLAGALPPLIGWAVATGGVGLEPILMVLVIFLWTPPHFWALALFTGADYARAGVPMMHVVAGPARTRRLILGYALALVPVGVAAAFTPVGGPLYLAAALGLGGWFALAALGLARRTEAMAAADRFRAEKRFFGLSLLHLFGHFAAFAAEAGFRTAGLSPAGWPQLW